MDELELIRWLDVLVETGMIKRWQTMIWSGGVPVFYVIDHRRYRREGAVGLVRATSRWARPLDWPGLRAAVAFQA